MLSEVPCRLYQSCNYGNAGCMSYQTECEKQPKRFEKDVKIGSATFDRSCLSWMTKPFNERVTYSNDFPLGAPFAPPTRCHLIWNSYALNTENEVDMGTAGQNEHYKCYSSVSSSVTPSEELMYPSWHLLFGWWCQQTSPVITSFILLCIDWKCSLQKTHRLLFLLKTWVWATNLLGIKLCPGIFSFLFCSSSQRWWRFL